MKSYIAVGAAALVLVGAGASRAAEKEIEWVKTYDEALKAAKGSGKLVMVDVYADWCGPCKMLDKQTYTDKKVLEFAKDKLISVKIDADADEGKKVGQKFSIDSLPTILFLDGDAKVQGKIVGFRAAAPFLAKMQQIEKVFKELPGMLAKLKDKPGDGALASQVAQAYIDRGEMREAEKVVGAAAKAGADAKQLAKAHNAVGDGYQETGRFDQAIREFKKAGEAGEPKDKVYAISSIAACLMSMGKMKDALAEVEKSLKVEGATDEDKKDATTLRDQLKEVVESQAKEAEGRTNAAKLMGWAKNYEDALAQAKESKKYAMLEFTADNCSWCKRLEADVFGDEKSANALRDVVVGLQVNIQSKEGEPVAKRYDRFVASGVPETLFVDAAGEVVGRISGYKPAEEFVKATKEIVTSAKEFPANLAAWKKDDKNTEAGVKVAKFHLVKGDLKEAQAVLKELDKQGVDLKAVRAMYMEIATALVEGGEGEDGEALLKRLSTDGNADERGQAMMMMAASRANRQDFNGALGLLDQAIKIEGLGQKSIEQIQSFRKKLADVMDAMKKQKESKKEGRRRELMKASGAA